MRDFIVKLSEADRRWVFLFVAVFTIVPFFIPLGFSLPTPTTYTKMVFAEVEKCGPDAKPILLSMDYDPGTLAELQPMSEAILRHIFARHGKVIIVTFMPTGAGLAQETVYRIAGDFKDKGIVEGENFAFLGFNFPAAACMQGIGLDIRNNYPEDNRGVPLDEMPIFKGVKNYADIAIVIDLAGNNYPVAWISNAHARFDARFAMGVTNVMAADFTPYIGKQSHGMLQGMVGAAEYERLLVEHGYWPTTEDATQGMDSQNSTHMLILFLIVLGNLGYFLGRKKGGAR